MNVMLESEIDLILWQFQRHDIAIDVGKISCEIQLVPIQQFSLRHLEH